LPIDFNNSSVSSEESSSSSDLSSLSATVASQSAPSATPVYTPGSHTFLHCHANLNHHLRVFRGLCLPYARMCGLGG
jgi:hypothetical protein